MHKRVLMLRCEFARTRGGFGQCVADQHDFCAMTFSIANLHERRVSGHHNRRWNAESTRVIGHALRVIACAHGDDAARPLFRCEREQFVKRATLFKACREL